MAPPKPDSAQLQHPRRLLMADLETHLMHYALDPNCTLILMGDMNIGLCTRDDDDGPALRLMMTRLGLISCAEARWPDSHRGFLTHRVRRIRTSTAYSSRSRRQRQCNGLGLMRTTR